MAEQPVMPPPEGAKEASPGLSEAEEEPIEVKEVNVRTEALKSAAGDNEVGKFRGLELKSHELELILRTAARSTVLRTLDLARSPISAENTDAIANLLKTSKTLEELILVRTSLPSAAMKVGGAKRLAKWVQFP